MKQPSKILLLIIFSSVIFAVTRSPAILAEGNAAQSSFPQNGNDKEMERAANKTFRNGVKLYKQGEYWRAAQELVIIMDFYPQFNKLDRVITYLGKCLFQEELFAGSTRLYGYLIKKYPRSPMIAEALLGLENNYYSQSKYKQALRVYYALIKKTRDRKILNEASYLAGQCHYYLKNYNMAIGVLKKIDGRSEYYASALYTAALCYLKKSNVATSVDYFRKITSLPIISPERREIVDNARLTLGLIYYELQAYDAATGQLSAVAEDHENYQDALLGLGWAYLKLNEYEKVIHILNKLIKKYPDSENAEESYFLLGQSYIALGRYDEAIASYRRIFEIFPERQDLPVLVQKVNYHLKNQQGHIEDLKVKILIEETKLLDAIPLNGRGQKIPDYLLAEKKRLKEVREKMIENLRAEKDQLVYMQEQIADMSKIVERRERRKDWRGYAEYGVSRALFLKELGTSRGK
ncbi:MAG: tetratricopeptide repeat protein [Calditrichaeota bacterium]|nr:tetratricopeptide repeat protein [Calditrichota bacterium]